MSDRLTPRRLRGMIGREVGRTDWFLVDQSRIDAFAAATEDRQWIHVDPERAAGGPLGGTVAHGFLLLSLLPYFNMGGELMTARFRMAVNYGLNRVRFPRAVRAGERVRNRAVLTAVERRGFRKVLVTVENTIEVEGADKPACVAELLALIIL